MNETPERAEAWRIALTVAHLWDMPPAVRDYLTSGGDDALRQKAMHMTIRAMVMMSEHDPAINAVCATWEAIANRDPARAMRDASNSASLAMPARGSA